MDAITINSIGIGKPKEYGEGENSFLSSYKKDQFFQFLEVDEFGISQDTQSDKRYHGGVDKAIHMGASEHFKRYEMDRLALGCNILVSDITEDDVCAGDIYSIGDIVLEVTQPRQPCWKIGALFGKEVSRYIIKNHACGWYLRVLQGGMLDINDSMILEKRVSQYTIKDLSTYLHTLPSKDIIDEVLKIEALADSYKEDLRNKF